MSEITIFIIGAFIFAITVYGSVMAGGLALTRAEESALPDSAHEGPSGDDAGLPSVPKPAADGTETNTDPT